MRCYRKLLLATFTAALLLAAVTTASGTRIASKAQQTFRATWRALRFINLSGTVECAVTLEGSFHSKTYSKVAELLIGYVSRAFVNACTGGSVIFLTTSLPWHIRYDGF